MVGLGIVLLIIAFQGSPSAQQGADPSIRVGPSDLGGVVTSANGPEAGVWVIAEANDLPTKLAKIVVTDERGRYLSFPDPQLANVRESGSAEASYYTWVDQFDTFGLGKDVPIATGNANESLLALVNGQLVNLREPYPLGFYTKWMDGRVDDPNAGWKGKGLWATVSTRAPRPDPLAR
jgi:hypothetical protein